MTIQLTTTRRSHLRDGAGANTHFCFNPSVYAIGNNPNNQVVQALIDLEVGYIRERWWPKNAAQQAAFAKLANAGIGFYLFVGDVGSSTPAQAQSDAAALAASPIASSVVAVCGPNEANSGGGNAWPAKVAAIQQAIYTEVAGDKSLKGASIVGTVLKHNVANLDADYQALAATGIARWCDAGDFHYYPGNAGPIGNATEADRAGQAYGQLPLWHSETGWTGADTTPAMAARFSVEAILRNHLSGIIGTILYEFADESQYVSGREGVFGLRTPNGPKAAYTAVQTLLATPDGNQDCPGALLPLKGVESDTDTVVTSEGSGNWTVYLLRAQQQQSILSLPAGFTADAGAYSAGANGNRNYTVPLTETMTTVHVSD